MGKRLSAALAAVFVLGALATGCGGGGAGKEPLLAGAWAGTLSLTTIAGRDIDGEITLVLRQDGDAAAGVASWAPLGDAQGAIATLDGETVTLRLSSFCRGLNGGVTLTGKIDEDTMVLEGATGIVCLSLDSNELVESGFANLFREPTAQPL